jgi:hypothetical protein
MSNGQIILTNSLDFNLSPLAMSPGTERFCLNATELSAQYKQVFNTSMQFGYICLAVGLIIGLAVMYFYMRNKYGM